MRFLVSKSDVKKLSRVLLSGCLLLSVLLACSPDNCEKMSGLRGVWVQTRSIMTPQKADEMLARIEAGHFNAAFVNVFAYGYAYYESVLLEKHPDLAPDHDPLAYVIEQAHQRDIEVHTWLVAGPVGGGKWGASPILSQHPDWAMVSLDGEKNSWLNYNRPDVRQFIGDIALEIVENYNVDGIHFDYTRYPHPGWKWGFDSYSATAFAEEYGLELEALRYSELPAYGSFAGNPLAGVSTAQVLAEFDNGRPAILINNYGNGQVILFNWDADERRIAASSEILDRSINYLAGENGDVYILHSKTNAEKYGFGGFDRGIAWLEDLGNSPIRVTEADVVTLSTDGVLVMPNVYLINAQVASDLADFVRRGGGVVFIDGPTPSVQDKNIQAITGMRNRGSHFKETGLLVATGEHDIIPNNDRGLELKDYQALDAQWKTFRQQGINKLLQDVYQRIKRVAPRVLVTITVAANQQTLAEQHFLDWQAWLEGKYVDLVIPRAYVDQGEPLQPIINDWQPALERFGRTTLALKTFTRQGDEYISKTPARVLAEIYQVCTSGSKGVILFDIEHTGNDVLEALATGSFSSPSTISNKSRE